VEDLAKYFGIKTKSIIVSEHQIPAHRLHRNGEAEVFIVTIQALTTGDSFKTIAEMMQTGRWHVVADEHHHYSQVRGKDKDATREDGIWADRLNRLNGSGQLAMSATSKRYDGLDRFGEPDVIETYVHAADLNYVKKLSLHAYEFHVEAVTVDGDVYTYSTDQFLAAVGSDNPADVDSFMAARQMHWSPKYITPLVTFPLDRMIDNRLKGIKSQMLIQAMSVAHAKFVCKQIELLMPGSMKVDWVGTGPNGRSDSENDAVLERFCPPKDKLTGQRKWTLDVLVNVGMAGEGLDSTDVTEISFLTSANITISALQIVGRGSRVMRLPDATKKPVCHINVDSSSPLADYVGRKVMGLFDDEITAKDPGPPRDREPGYEPSPENMNVLVVDVRLKDIRS
jgi:superfamily II DNA or RNA helicase